ncbi:MAG: hypothetical protein IMZ47_03095 [Firmicutes bacterium]|nr:hypothetical protein [Bacillota bacterium]
MKLPRMKPSDLLVIKLWDLTNYHNWLPDEQAQAVECTEVAVCGWLISKDKRFIRISAIVGSDGEKTILAIPRGFLKSVRVITYDRVDNG